MINGRRWHIIAFDKEQNRFVELHIVPHPSLELPKTIEIEYSMTDGKLVALVRAAVAGYVLRLWRVDCSIDHK